MQPADPPIDVWFQGRLAAVSSRRGLAVLQPHIAVLESDHPIRWFVRLMLVDAAVTIDGGGARQFDSARAERTARQALIPRGEIARSRHLPDAALAERCNVPVEQVALRRNELGDGQGIAGLVSWAGSVVAGSARALLTRVLPGG